MKKREFLAMGGAVPLMLAGCGGNGAGNAPMRLVNASVGYPGPLGFMDESNQITTGISYGSASPFFNVQAGTVNLTLTETISGKETSVTSAQPRNVIKDQRYTLVAYGVLDELRLVNIAENTNTLDAGTATVNVLNTSVDIGAVDVYLSTTKDLSAATLIAQDLFANSSGPGQSAFAPDIQPGAYYITVVGANTVQENISDVRFQSSSPVTLAVLEILTVILTPGVGGILANVILLTQGTASVANATVPLNNTTARARAVTSIPGDAISVNGTSPSGTAVTLLASSTTPKYSDYFVVSTGAPPVVTVSGNPVAVVMDDPTSTTTPPAEIAASLGAGGDYTLMVYTDSSGNPKAKITPDDNTAPVTAQGMKFRLINLASDNQSLQLSMLVNKLTIASNIPYATASKYTEVSVPQSTSSTIQVNDGAETIISDTTALTLQQLPNIFTEIVVSDDPTTGKTLSFFSSTSGN